MVPEDAAHFCVEEAVRQGDSEPLVERWWQEVGQRKITKTKIKITWVESRRARRWTKRTWEVVEESLGPKMVMM